MAYVDKQPLSHRLANLGTAGLIQVGIGVALVAGLSTTFVPVEDVPQIGATNIPAEPPPPQPNDPPPEPQHAATVTQMPPPPIPWNPPQPPEIPMQGYQSEAVPGPTTGPSPTPPSATPSPTREPALARPSNSSSNWVTPDDYPSRDLREGNQGTTGFRVIVGSNGRVQSCEITRSSGFASLDKATCDRVSRRARFDPATDDAGARIVGTYSSAVVWRIPR